MDIVFRTDASLQIGSGHVMRCLTLADALRQRGADSMFVCRKHPGHLVGLIEGKGYQVVCLEQPEAEFAAVSENVAHASWLGVSWEQDATDIISVMGGSRPQWLIIDHYAIDRLWEQKLRSHVGKILVIDDLADRPHDCDLLLDQNLYQEMETRYDKLVPESCQKLLGPKFALLRPEFVAARKNFRQRNGEIKRVLVFFGGVDPSNETEKALQTLADFTDRQFDVDVVVGGANLHKEQIQNFCAVDERFHYFCQVDNMAELMASADLAIGAGGTATWERCYLGLPSIIVVIADNQHETTKAVAAAGATMYIGYCDKVASEDFAVALRHLLKNALLVKDMGEKSLAIMGSSLSQESRILVDLIMEGRRAKA